MFGFEIIIRLFNKTKHNKKFNNRYHIFIKILQKEISEIR